MWNRIIGKSSEVERKSSTSEHHRKSDGQRSTPRRSESLKSTTASRQTPRSEEHDRGFNPTSTSYSSTTQNQYPGTASASIASSYATAFNDTTNQAYLPPRLNRNASLADQITKTSAGDGSRPAALDLTGKKEKEKEKGDSETMEDKRARKERRSTRDRDEDRRETKGRRDNKRRNSEKGKERTMSTDEAAYINAQGSDSIRTTSMGLNGRSSSVPLAGQHDDHGSGYIDRQPRAKSSHVQDQFPGQFPAQAAAPYRPRVAASEGGPGLAAEYYGDAGQSVVDQPGVRTQSPSLIVGAEPHLQSASAVAAPPLEPSASGGIGAAASFFNGTFSAGSNFEGHQSQKPNLNTAPSISQYSSAGPPTSTYSISGGKPTSLGSTSAPVIPTLGAAAAGAAAGYYFSNHDSKPVRPDQASTKISGYGQATSSSSHHQHSETHGSYTSHPSSTRPSTKPGKSSSQSSNAPLYAAGAAGLAAAAYRQNHHDFTGHSSHGHGQQPIHHSSTGHYPHGQHYSHNEGSMAQKHRHQNQGPFSQLVDFFKDPDGVAQFEEYTEYIGVCRHCFDPHSSPRDAPRRHRYRRRRSNERYGSSVRVDKDNRYSSSENGSRRRKNNKSWLEAGIAGYGLAKMGESLFRSDSDSHDSHGARHRKLTKSRRRSSSSSERKSRTSYGIVNKSSDTLSHKSGSNKDRIESGITADGKLYRKDTQGHFNTSTVKTHDSRRHSRSPSRDRHSKIASIGLGAAVGSGVIASSSHRRSRSPKKAFVRSKYEDKEGTSELASVLRLNESDPHDSRHRSRHSPDSTHRNSRKNEKKGRGFFNFSNGSSSSSASSTLAVRPGHERKAARSTKTKKKDKDSREVEAALLGLGAAALTFNQSQRSKRKGELIAVKESKGKHKADRGGHKGGRPSSSSEEDQWESASEGDYSSADSELAYGASLRRRSQESLSSDSSGLDKWSWRWGSKKQPKRATRDRRQSSGLDNVGAVAATAAIMTGAHRTPSSVENQDSRMTSTSSVPLQHVYPMPTSDPTQFDVGNHDSGVPSYQLLMNARPDPVPIQHPQPLASVPPAVYTTQGPYSHSYSEPSGLSQTSGYPHPPFAIDNRSTIVEGPHDDLPGSFPTGNEYFQSFTTESKKESNSRRRESSPVTHASEFTSSSAAPRRRRSLKDDASSVRFDLTKEQEDKDRREERRRRKEEDQRRERLERREPEERKAPKHDSPSKWDIAVTESSTASVLGSTEQSINKKKESWAAPAAAGVIAAAIGATVAVDSPRKDRSETPKAQDSEERDIEVIIKERPVTSKGTAADDGRGRPLEEKPMSIWQAAAKVKRSSTHTEYAAYFAPTELLSESAGVKETAGGANADNDVTVFHVPNMITIEPSEPRGVSPSRAYSFPISAEDLEHGKKPLPWAVPKLNLVEATPPTSRAGSVIGSRSPRSRSPLTSEVSEIPLEPLESVVTPGPSADQPTRVEYTVIEPKERGTALVDSPLTDTSIPKTVPGISSLRKKAKERKTSPPKADHGDDFDFAATVAAGLQDTGFNPSIVIDNPSFHRRDSPPGSENDDYRRRPTSVVTEITPEALRSRSPPHGFVEEIREQHIPGSFEDIEELKTEPQLRKDGVPRTKHSNERTPEELTGPSDNADVKPNVYSTEEDAFKPEDITNAAVDPVGTRPYPHRDNANKQAAFSGTTKPSDNDYVKPNVYSTENDSFKPEDIDNAAIDLVESRPHYQRYSDNEEAANEVTTEPADNAHVKPRVYTAEPDSFGPDNVRNIAIGPELGDQRSDSVLDRSARSQPPYAELTDGRFGTADSLSDETPSVAATARPLSSSRKDSMSNKRSKRRSGGNDDKTSVISSPAAHRGTQESSSPSKQSRKGGIFGLFSKSTENLSGSKGLQQTPVEASLKDFEEPRERKKKSKSRRADRDDDEPSAVTKESVVSGQPKAEDDWDTPKKSKRGKEKRRSSGDPGRITQDLPAQVIAPAFPSHNPILTSNEMLTYLENQEPGRSAKQSQSDRGIDEIAEPSREHDYQQPSFLGERPKQPPLPDIPDASEDPGGQPTLERRALSEQDLSASLAMGDNRPQRPLSDFQPEGRSVSYSSSSPTAIPLRPLRFGRRPSSPGLARSLPSTPQPSATADLPMTPRRRERPHSTEFKSNEFRPMWLLEKYGSRQEPVSRENYPSLPSSHSTSRASSTHESDGFHQTEALDLALDERSYQPLKQDPQGLSIDTGHRENESELLDSQQATPTAATFHRGIKEDHENTKERKAPIVIEESKPEFIDVIPPASAYIDPLDEVPHDQRLLHGVEDLFPQRRASSPARYDTGIDKESSVKSISRDSSPPLSSTEGKEGNMTMINDAALGAFIEGPAAALLKSTSQTDEYQEQASNKSDIAEPSTKEIESMPKPADVLLGRPTAEETRLMQEQDAQDAVDSWFTPAQPRMSRLGKKDRKRGKSYEGAQSTSSTNSSKQVKGAGAEKALQSIANAESRSVLGDAVMTAEPTESTVLPQLEAAADEPSTQSVDTSYEAALTSRRDSKGKKKKNKKKTSDPSENPNTELLEPTTEQITDLEEAPKRSLDESSNLSAGIGTSREDRTPSIFAESEEPLMSAKKIKKRKKRDRSLPLAALDFDQPQVDISVAESAEAVDLNVSNKQPVVSTVAKVGTSERDKMVSDEVPYEFPVSEEARTDMSTGILRSMEKPDVPAFTDVGESEAMDLISEEAPYRSQVPETRETQTSTDPPRSMKQPDFSIITDGEKSVRNRPISEDIPYKFPAPEEAEIKLPINLLQSTEQPSVRDSIAEPDASISATNASLDESFDDRTLEATTTPTLTFRHTDEVIPSSREFEQSAVESRIPPEAIPLPLDDDLDLLEALPQSPILQPVDAPAIAQEGDLGTHDASIPEPVKSDIVQNQASEALDNPPVVLSKAISELTLPESAAAAQAAKAAEAATNEELVAFPDKKGKRKEKSKKNKAPKAPAFEIGSPTESPPSSRLASGSNEPEKDLFLGESESSITAFTPSTHLGGMFEGNYETPQEQPADNSLDFTTTTSKREMEVRKDMPMELETEKHSSESSVPVTESTPFQRVKDISVQGKESSAAAHQLPGQDGLTMELATPFPNQSRTGHLVEEPLTRSIEQDELPIMKKEKTKKGKKVQFDDLNEAQSQESQAAAVPDVPLATTSTASEVVDLLHSRDLQRSELTTENNDPPSRENPSIASFEKPFVSINEQLASGGMTLSEDIPKGSGQTRLAEVATTGRFILESPAGPVEAHQAGQVDRPTSGESHMPFTAAATASTETTAAVQGMLSKVEEPDSAPAAGERPIADPRQAIDADESAWAPSQEKKKGKRSKRVKDTVSVDAPEPGTLQSQGISEAGAPIPGAIPEYDPVEEFSIKQSKKDKGNKRDGLSGSASDFEEKNDTEDMPPIFEKSFSEKEMAITDNAPSILERTGQLPSIQMPKSPEAAQPMIPYIDLVQPGTDLPSRGPDSQRGAEGGLRARNPVAEESFAPADEALIVPDLEETAVFADAPSILEKHDELSDIGQPISSEAREPISPVTVPGDLSSTLAGDIFSPTVARDGTQTITEASASNETMVPMTTDHEPSLTMFTGETEKVAEYTGHVSDENAGPAPEPSLKTPAKSKKDKRRSKKAKELEWTEEPALESPNDQTETAQLAPEELREDVAAPEPEELSIPLAQTVTHQQETPARSNTQKEESRESRGLAWDDDTTMLVTEPPTAISEEQKAVVKPDMQQSAGPVVDNDSAIATEAVSKSKNDMKTQNTKASASDYEIPAESMENIEPSQEVVDAELERSLDPPVVEAPVVAEELPKSKKDKKKSKKSKALSWEEEGRSIEPTALPQQIVGNPMESSETPADEPVKSFSQQSTSQKRKGKGKKSKYMAFDEDEPEISAGAESQLQAVTRTETEAVGGDLPQETVESSAVRDRAVADQQPMARSKKRGKKQKFVDFDEELSGTPSGTATPSRDEVDLEEIMALPSEVVAGQRIDDRGPTEVEQAIISPEEQSIITKGKKRGKKSKFVDFDEKPLVPPSSNEEGQPVSQPLDAEAYSEPLEPIQEPAVVERTIFKDRQPSSKKGTKKGKKSTFVDFDTDVLVPASRDEADQQENVGLEHGSVQQSASDQSFVLPDPTSIDEAVEFPDEQSTSRKGKKKGKKSKFVDLDHVPSISLVKHETEPNPVIDAPEIIQSVPLIQHGGDDGFGDHESVASLPESKKDEKKAKKAKVFLSDEESAPAIVELPTPDVSRLPSDIVDSSTEPASQFSTEAIGNINESIPANEIEKELATAAMEREGLQTEDLTVSEVLDNATNTGDSHLETTEGAFVDESNLSTAGPETLSEPSIGDTNNLLSVPPSDMVAAGNDNASKLEEEGAEIRRPSVSTHGNQSAERIDLPTTDIPDRNESPLLIQADHVQIDPVPAPSMDNALEVAEANIPATTPVETMVDRTPLIEDNASEPMNPVIASAASPNFLSAETGNSKPPDYMIGQELDSPVIESDLVHDAGPVDVTEDLPPVSKRDKKKAKKGKNVIAWEDEDSGRSQAEKTASNEMIPARDMPAEQPSVLTTTPSEQTLEDFPTVSRKDKKKSKKKNKVFSFDDELSENTTPIKLDDNADVLDQVVDEAPPISEQGITEQSGEFQLPSKKDKKKAKKKKQVFSLSDEPSESTTPAEMDPQTDMGGQTTEDPSLPAEPTVPKAADEFLTSKKDKKSKKSGKSLAFDEELPVSKAPLETGLDIPNLEKRLTEPPTTAIQDVTENVDDLVPLGKKGKKSKKSKKDYSFVDEPSGPTTPAEPKFGKEKLTASIEQPSLPVSEVRIADESPLMSKKAFDFDKELSETPTPAEPDLEQEQAFQDQLIEKPSLPAETSIAEAADGIVSSKKEKKSKKKKKAFSFDDEPLETTISVKPDFEEGALDPATEDPSVPAGPSLAEGSGGFAPLVAGNKKRSRDSKGVTELTGEPPKSLTSTEGDLEEDALVKEEFLPVEVIKAELREDFLTTSEKGKNSETSSKSYAFDVEPSEVAAPAEPDFERGVRFDEPRVPTEATVVDAEAFPTLDKKQKKSKKTKKASTFDEEPSNITTPTEVSDKPMEEVPLPAEAEVIEDLVSMSKKDRKKAKKDRKTAGFDEEFLERDLRGEAAKLTEETAGDVPLEFASSSKKNKKKVKKATKAFAWEDENPDDVTAEEVAPFDDQPQTQSSVVPSVPQLEQGQEDMTSRPRDILPQLPAYSNLTTEEQRGSAAPILGTTPALSHPTEAGEREVVPEAQEFVGSKKNQKKLQKAQAFSWSDDERAIETPPRDLETSAGVTIAPLPQIQEGQIFENITEPADPADAPSAIKEIKQAPTIGSTVSSALVEQVLAPRHQDPASLAPADTAPLEASQPPPLEKTFEHEREVDVGPSAEQQNIQSADLTGESMKAATQAPARHDDQFNSFTPTAKPKKSKKGKKQAINWEDETVPPQDSVQKSSKAADDIDITSRPEILAWPTEVRVNQDGATPGLQDDASYSANIIDDPMAAKNILSDDEPLGPAPVEDNRSDYFGPSISRDAPSQLQPFGNETIADPAVETTQADTDVAMLNKDVQQAATAEQRTGQLPTATEEPVLHGVTASAINDSESFVPTKKDKKSKRKKKLAVDDIMWEFPPIAPAQPEESTPLESKWPSDPSRRDRLYIPPSSLSAKEKQDLADTEYTHGEEISRGIAPDEPPVDSQIQADTHDDTTLPSELSNGEAVDDDVGSFSRQKRKGKKFEKGKKSENGRKAEAAEELLANTPRGDYVQEQVEDQSRADETSTGLSAGAGKTIGHAAAVGAGMVAAVELGRESLKYREGQQADISTEPEEDEPPIRGPSSQDDAESKRTPTPRRRSPIQAWHQNISTSQSPKRSELYEVEDNRPRSATSTRRKRSYDEERRAANTPERRSPIEAWHQYNTPRHSPQQSELYNYDERKSRSPPDQPATSAINRDSAVHVSDSPTIAQQSPVRRVMRDSGYPDTEASPVIGQGSEVQKFPEVTAQVIGGDDGHESTGKYPLRAPDEDYADYDTSQGQKSKRTRSESPETHHKDLDLPPRHPIQQTQSFEDLREPSPVSSTTKDRSSVLFQSSPSTREEQGHQEPQGLTHDQEQEHEQARPRLHEHLDNNDSRDSHAADRSLTPDREDNSAMVNARAESLAALSGLGRSRQEQQRPSLFGGPLGISSNETPPETPTDHDGANRRRLNTITEYSPEESPLHKKNRDLSDVGISTHGVKAARRSGTPLAISKRRASPPQAESGKGLPSPTNTTPRPFWPSPEDDVQPMDIERSHSRGMEPRPSSHQSNISSLVTGPPKQREYERRSLSATSNHSIESINAIIRTPPDQMRSASGMSNRSSGTPPLRRADRSVSSDLRGANRKSEAKKRAKQPEAEIEADTSIPTTTSSTTHDDSTKDKSKSRVREMANVFVSHDPPPSIDVPSVANADLSQEGYGDFHGSPLSPTRPPSVRRRQSMQVLELETHIDRLSADNRQLLEAKSRAERDLEAAAHDRNQEIASYRDGIETRESWLRQKDTELGQLNEMIESLQGQVAHLNEVNEGLQASSRRLDEHQERYGQLEEEHAATHQRWQQSTREIEDLRQQHAQLSAGMEDIVRHEVTTAVEEKNLELHRLQTELSAAKDQIRTLQAQILAQAKRSDDTLLDRDEDYFDTQCQSLCQHVQQWVLRFSKFSDSRACYLASEIRDEKVVDRMENAILDGSDVDTYLADRVKRRDVFMSMVMTMTWEFIFTRYLFGADREQRQKLKSLEKTLSESAERAAVHRWRATTLHLLSRREAFKSQRAMDTEAVMHTIYETLAAILPPPGHLVSQVQASLNKVLGIAVDLSIEMRTQKFEYVMLPPLQPEYDTNGDLARK
ncbi:MAG: hypothetical protein Q9224_000224, partial [Gallowayella concinna]